MALKLKSFAQPDLLKQIQAGNLFQLLNPYRLFLEMKGLTFPAGPKEDVDHLTLAAILVQPDEDMPAELVEALHVIGNFSEDQHFDDLLLALNQAGLDVEGDATTPDLAVRLYLHDPQKLERKEREQLFERRKNFESYRAADPAQPILVDLLPSEFGALEQDLDRYFDSKKRGVGCRVIRKDSQGEIRFLVQHGQTCRREPSRKGPKSTSTFFRPERTDVVILDVTHNEMRINASNLADLREYRVAFGRHLFGIEDRFIFAEKYTLEPLKRRDDAGLNCRDVEGIESVRLREIEYSWGGAFEHIETHWADDLLKALMVIDRAIEQDAHIRRAVFKIKLQGEKKPRNVTIRAGNRSAYNRGEEATLIEDWLHARGFVLPSPEVTIENLNAAMART